MRGINFGVDLETKILVRLPAKSLMRFKCVQRSWNLLFKSPTFVARHDVHTQSKNHCLITVPHNHNIMLLSSDFDSNDPTPTHIPFTSLFPNPNKFPTRIRILSYGHCNGIFCLHDIIRDQLILWNPTTREVHAIPPPPFPYRPDPYPNPPYFHPGMTVSSLFAFGAADSDHPNDLRVVNLHVDNYTKSKSTVQNYSLGTKSWTIIHGAVLPLDTVILRYRPSKYNALVNGVYHWIMGYGFNGIREGDILCFHFRNNQFSKLKAPIPHNFHTRKACQDIAEIAEINGSLAYVVQFTFHDCFLHPDWVGVWVMDQRAWAMKYRIGPIGPEVQILGIWIKDGARVLGGKVGELLTSYDQDGNPVHQFQIKVRPRDQYELCLHDYVQSIAPLST